MSSPQPVLRVQGQGAISSKPDVVVLNFGVSALHLDYATAVGGLNQRIADLRKSAEGAGIDPKLLKTTSFSVSAEHEYQGKKHVFAGFAARQSLELRQPFDQEHLARVFRSVCGSRAEPVLKISFTVSDPEEVKRRVLAAAVRNAHDRANVIAEASGQKLGAILSIDYGYSEIRISSASQDVYSDAVCEAALDMDPADIESDDTVRIAWQISAKSSDG